MYIHLYVYIYVDVCVSVCVYLSLSLSIYIYIYNRHLGLINTPPLFVLFLQATFFTIHVLSKRPYIYTIMAKTLLIRREIPAVHLGGHLGDHPFSLKARPPQK